MRGPLFYLLIAAVLGATAVFVREPSGEDRLQDEADRLQQRIAKASVELGDLCGSTAQALTGDSTSNWQALAKQRDALAPDGIELLGSWNGTRYWTSSLPLDEHSLDTAITAQVRSGSTVYLRAGALSKQGSLHALRLLWYQPPFENRYLRQHFHPSLGVAHGVEASVVPGLGPVVRDPQGDVLFRLQWADEVPTPGTRAWTRLLAAFASLAMALCALWTWLGGWAARGRQWAAIATMLAIVSALRWWSLNSGPWPLFEGFSLFAPNLLFASAMLPR